MLFEDRVLLVKAAPFIYVLMKTAVVLLPIQETLLARAATFADTTWDTAFSVLMTAIDFTTVPVGGTIWQQNMLMRPGIEMNWVSTVTCPKSCSG